MKTLIGRSTAAKLLLLLAIGLLGGGCKQEKGLINLPAPPSATPVEVTGKTLTAGKKTAPTQPLAPTSESSAPIPKSAVASGTVLNGTTKAARTTQLAPRVSGMVKQVLFKEGDVVQKNALLVQLDRTDFLLQLRMAQAARNTAKAQLEAVKTEWTRLRSLLKARAIPSGQFDKVDSQFKVAQAGMAQAEVAISAARTALSKTSVRAPFRAVVTRKMTEIGAYATVMPPSPVVVLQEIDPIEVVIQVPEAQLLAVKTGTAVQLTFSAINKRSRARVDRVVPSLDPRTRSFSAYVVLKNEKHELKPGMFVEVLLLRGTK